jgi:N,N'-diacetyllegionaminate synthase
MTTPFYEGAIEIFEGDMPAIKIASGDLTYSNLLRKAGQTGKPVILSTGMASFDEIDRSLGLLTKVDVALMHCVSLYPTPPASVNLVRIAQMKERWPNITVGYSDHSVGNLACVGAVALGARVIEKHFTNNNQKQVGDHLFSANPKEMAELVASIREMEDLVNHSRQDSLEIQMKKHLRRGIYARRSLGMGERVESADLIFIRPEVGIPASDVDEVIGKEVIEPIEAMQAIRLENLKSA